MRACASGWGSRPVWTLGIMCGLFIMPWHGIMYLGVSLDWAVPWVSLNFPLRCIATVTLPVPSGYKRASPPPLAIGADGGREARGPGLSEPGSKGAEAGTTQLRSSILLSYETHETRHRPLRSQRRAGLQDHTHNTRARAHRSPEFTRAHPCGPTRLSRRSPLTPAS